MIPFTAGKPQSPHGLEGIPILGKVSQVRVWNRVGRTGIPVPRISSPTTARAPGPVGTLWSISIGKCFYWKAVSPHEHLELRVEVKGIPNYTYTSRPGRYT